MKGIFISSFSVLVLVAAALGVAYVLDAITMEYLLDFLTKAFLTVLIIALASVLLQAFTKRN